jgi:hypothetical protein
MAHFLGICNSSPAKVAELLVKRRIINTVKEVAILPIGSALQSGKSPRRNFIFILSISDVLRNISILNSSKYKNVSIFIFASPIRLNELNNIHYLDLLKDPSAKGFGFNLKPSIDVVLLKNVIRKESLESKPLIRNDREHLTILTDSIKQGSLLTPLMTFIYSLPSSTLQYPVKLAVAKIIAKGLPTSKLDSAIKDISDYSLSVSAKEKLVNILDSEVGDTYKKAFKYYYKVKKEKGTVDINTVAKKFDVTAYEIRYIISILENSKKNVERKKVASR